MQKTFFHFSRLRFLTFFLLLASAIAPTASAQQPDEIRALWAQAWVADLHSPAGINKLIADARSANFNTLIVQMRRRGDTLHFSDIEPRITSGIPGFATFDPLAYILQKAREQNPPIEVHAWIVVYPVDSSSTNPQHVKYTHPEWMTQTRSGEIKLQLDPGHPGVHKHLLDVSMELITKYDIDGLHYDYIRYDGNQYGFNPVTVARFQNLYNRTDLPQNTDAQWSEFRRNQVSDQVRTIYLHAMAVRPEVKISASTITWSPGPATVNHFHTTRPYYDILSNWPEWMREGIIDLNVPMAYFREQNATQKADYRRWANFIRDTQYNRHAVIGPGIYLNELNDSITQMRESRNQSPAGNRLRGVAAYTYHQVSVDTSVPFSEFRKALTQPSQYDSISPPLFAQPAAIPEMPWKTNPTTGHLMGYTTDDGSVLDGVTIHLSGTENRTIHTTATGFYGFVDLAPGTYLVQVESDGVLSSQRSATVTVGEVTQLDLEFELPPPTTGELTGTVRNAANGSAVSGATIHLTGPVSLTAGSDITGKYLFPQLPPGNYTVYASLGGEIENTPEIRISVTIGETTGQDLHFLIGSSYLPGTEIIVDNLDSNVTFTGPDWRTGTFSTGYADVYNFAHNPSHGDYAGLHTATFSPVLPSAGFYKIETWYPAGANRSPNAHYLVSDGNSDSLVYINQMINGSQWVTVAENVYLDPAKNPFVRIDNRGSGSVTMVDAVKWTSLEAVPAEATHLITASVIGEGRIDGLPIDGIAAHGSTLTLTAVGENGFVFSHWNGKNAWGTENPLALEVGADLELTAVFFSPWREWVESNFTQEEQADPQISGPNADPTGTGIPNLLKFAFGIDPESPDFTLLPSVTADDTGLILKFRRNIAESGIQYLIEQTTDLINWSSAENNLALLSAEPNGDGTETVRIRITNEEASRFFVRLRVQ